MEPVFLGEFANKEDVESNFEYTLVGDQEILLAHYDNEGYDGDAFVLVSSQNQLWEVAAGHCSCNGLEGTWEPELTTPKALRTRIKEGHLGSETFATFLTTVLDQWEKDHDRVVH